MIGMDLYESCFLDIFSGSGAIGIEALSRGAKEAVFIEQSKAAYKIIQTNINKTKFTKESTVLNMGAEEALDKLGHKNKKFDVIFMDPPYNRDMINETIDLIIKNKLLSPEGYIIIERPTGYKIEDKEGLYLWKEKKYSVTTMSFLKGDK